MSAASEPGGACPACAPRPWLLGELSGPLELCARRPQRLVDVLALSDEQLIAALGGRRSRELSLAHAELCKRQPRATYGERWTCRHRPDGARTLSGAGGPGAVQLSGPPRSLARLTSVPVVAIIGSTSASDYGMRVAASLGRSLAAAGVSAVAPLRHGVGAAAIAGSLQGGAGAIAVLASGLQRGGPARLGQLAARVAAQGCCVSELEPTAAPRRWTALAAERLAVQLADACVIVEARDRAGELLAAPLAASLGRPVAAVPGRVGSPLAAGPLALIAGGTPMARSARDVLDLLAAAPPAGEPAAPGVHPELLAMVACGDGDLASLASSGLATDALLCALSELELAGLITRGDGGRYLPADPMRPLQ